MGQKLNHSDMQLLEEVLIRQMFKKKERQQREDGKMYVTKTMNIDPLLSAIPEYAAMAASTQHLTGRRYKGSVDIYTAQTWAKECGEAIGTKEYQAYAKKKLESPEFAKFRAPTHKFIH